MIKYPYSKSKDFILIKKAIPGLAYKNHSALAFRYQIK